MGTKDNEKLNEQEVEATVDNEQQETVQPDEQETEQTLDPLQAAEAKIEELQQQLLYKQAEFENYRKRVIKEKAELLLNGAEKTVVAMLPIIDDLERAMQNMNTADNVEAVRKGVELIQQKFLKTMEGLGVKPIDTTNADFSTDMHEAIAQIPAQSDELKGKVIDCVQTGYTLNDKVIRYAKVAVGV